MDRNYYMQSQMEKSIERNLIQIKEGRKTLSDFSGMMAVVLERRIPKDA